MFAATNGARIRALWSGDTSGYSSHSEADAALCFHLAFWCGRDAIRIDRLFRQSELRRDKWDERHYNNGRTYGQETIARACAACTETYAPRPEPGAKSAARETEQHTHHAEIASPTPWHCSLQLLEADPPTIDFLMDDVLAVESVVLLAGREGSLKSFLAMEWSHCLARGIAWLGRQCRNVKVLYLDAEMPSNVFFTRLSSYGGAENLNVWRWTDADFPTRLDDARLIAASKAHHVIIIDTTRRFMANLKENSSDDMAVVTAQLRELTRSGCTVVALHHGKKDKEDPGYRGSTELGAGVDVSFAVQRKVKDDQVRVEISAEKTRYSEDSRLSLLVRRGPGHPVFQDAHSAIRAGVQAQQDAHLNVLGAIIEAFPTPPTQKQIIDECSRRKTEWSRHEVLRLLKVGEGRRWYRDASAVDRRVMLYNSILSENLSKKNRFTSGYPYTLPGTRINSEKPPKTTISSDPHRIDNPRGLNDLRDQFINSWRHIEEPQNRSQNPPKIDSAHSLSESISELIRTDIEQTEEELDLNAD